MSLNYFYNYMHIIMNSTIKVKVLSMGSSAKIVEISTWSTIAQALAEAGINAAWLTSIKHNANANATSMDVVNNGDVVVVTGKQIAGASPVVEGDTDVQFFGETSVYLEQVLTQKIELNSDSEELPTVLQFLQTLQRMGKIDITNLKGIKIKWQDEIANIVREKIVPGAVYVIDTGRRAEGVVTVSETVRFNVDEDFDY